MGTAGTTAGWESPSLDPLRRIHDAQLVGWGGDGTLGYLVIIENAKVPIVKFTHGPRCWGASAAFPCCSWSSLFCGTGVRRDCRGRERQKRIIWGRERQERIRGRERQERIGRGRERQERTNSTSYRALPRQEEVVNDRLSSPYTESEPPCRALPIVFLR